MEIAFFDIFLDFFHWKEINLQQFKVEKHKK